MNRGKSMHDHQYNGKLLPTHWHQVKLEDVCDMVMGQSPSSSTYNKDGQGLPFLQGKAEFTNLHPIASVYCTDPLKIAKKGSVLISVRAPVGDVNIADQDYIIGRGLGALLLKDGFNPFLFFSLLYNKERLKSQGSGTTFDSITKSTLANFSIFLPPLPEQRAIAYVLQTVQNVIQARRKEVALERERKAALMQHLFTHGTRGEATKQTEIGEMPESWELVRVEEVFNLQLGKMLSPKAKTGQSSKPYMRNANVQWGYVDCTEVFEMDFDTREQEKFRLQYGDILVCEGGEVGRTAIWRDELPECYFQKAIHRLRPKNGQVEHFFFLYHMERAFHLEQIYGIAGTQTTIAHLPQDKLSAMLIPKPNMTEQQQIAAILQACDSKITALEKEIALQEELFRALLEELMSGRLSALPLVEAEGGAREALS